MKNNFPKDKHALVIQGSEEEKQQACIEIRNWAVKNGIPIHEWFLPTNGCFGIIDSITWDCGRLDTSLYIGVWLDSLGFTLHHTVDSFKKVFEVEEKEPMFTLEQMEDCFKESRLTHPMIGFKHKDFNEYKSTIQEFKPIELTNPKK